MGRMLMGLGALVFLVGVAVQFGGKFFAPGRLPGDLVFQRGNFTFFFPIGTSLLLSLLLTGLLWLLRRF